MRYENCNTHNGICLGQALYKITAWLGITNKVQHICSQSCKLTYVQIGHVTCNNAANMDIMMTEFMEHTVSSKQLANHLMVNSAGCSKCCYIPIVCHTQSSFRCLAHIVNLAMQALLSTYSKLKAYNPKEPNTDLIAMHSTQHDEVGSLNNMCQGEIICKTKGDFSKAPNARQGELPTSRMTTSAITQYVHLLVFNIFNAQAHRSSP